METIKNVCEISNEKFIALIAGVVAAFIIIGISSDESQETINAKAGLEECVIKDGYLNRQGNLEPRVIWTKDCIATQTATK